MSSKIKHYIAQIKKISIALKTPSDGVYICLNLTAVGLRKTKWILLIYSTLEIIENVGAEYEQKVVFYLLQL